MAAVWKRVRHAVHHLRWRLTMSYVAVTVGTLLTLVLILSALLFSRSLGSDEYFSPEFWYQATAAYTVPTIQQILTTAPDLLPLWVDSLETRSPPREILQFANGTQLVVRHDIQLSVAIIGADGTLLAASNPQLAADIAPAKRFEGASIPGVSERLALALTGENDVSKLTFTDEAADLIGFVVPIPAESKADYALGALVGIVRRLPTGQDISTLTLGLAGRSLILLLLGAGAIGALFGTLTARGIVARFEHLAAVARLWSRGHFTTMIDDPTGDELSLLGQQMNAMAQQLDHLLARRQEMAISEERNRLARDLHDSAKQQALAASFQIGSALALFEREPESARKHLGEADSLVNAVRKELTEVIHQLRPPEPDETSPAEELSNYARQWSVQTGIQADVLVVGDCVCGLATSQALLRILQEALANVARHSAAQAVRIELACDAGTVTLAIADDGCGFDPDSVRGGLGLASMRERTQLLGGQFDLKTAQGIGTRIRSVFPVSPDWGNWSKPDG